MSSQDEDNVPTAMKASPPLESLLARGTCPRLYLSYGGASLKGGRRAQHRPTPWRLGHPWPLRPRLPTGHGLLCSSYSYVPDTLSYKFPEFSNPLFCQCVPIHFLCFSPLIFFILTFQIALYSENLEAFMPYTHCVCLYIYVGELPFTLITR